MATNLVRWSAAAIVLLFIASQSVLLASALTCSEMNSTHNGVLAPLLESSFKVEASIGTFILRICAPAFNFHAYADSAAVLSGGKDRIVKLGLVKSAQLLPGTGWLLLVYTGGDSYTEADNVGNKPACNGSHGVRIVMECNPNVYKPDLELISEVRNEPSQCHHLFSLQHYSLCGLVPDASASLTPLVIVIVAILTAFIAYLGVGMLIQRFYFGRRGAAQIPNYTAWQRFGNAAASCCDLVCRSEPRPPRIRYADNDGGSGGGGGTVTHHLYADQDDDHLLPA